jgi:hypothetical protein
VARSLVDQGKKELEALPATAARDFLCGLADAAVDRNQ